MVNRTPADSTGTTGSTGRQRLDQIDAMRPIKQAGVVSTHAIIFFAPAWASVSANAVLLLLHVSREAFFVISACMLTYAYMGLTRGDLKRFYWRRFVSVGIPYLCWNLIYFLYTLPQGHHESAGAALAYFWRLLCVGYNQLYFLLVIMQFYILFPFILALLKRTRGHHGLVMAVTAVVQVVVNILTHWHKLPYELVAYAQDDPFEYVLFLIGGAVAAFHLRDVDQWLRKHVYLIFTFTVLAAVFAEAVYYLAEHGVTTILGSTSDPFQPSVIPFNLGFVACVYLIGVALVNPNLPRRMKGWVKSGSDNAYGVYLSQVLFLLILQQWGWEHLMRVVSWPVVIVLTLAIVYTCGLILTNLLARTPLAVPLTGRKQVPWRTPRTRGSHRRDNTAPAPSPDGSDVDVDVFSDEVISDDDVAHVGPPSENS